MSEFPLNKPKIRVAYADISVETVKGIFHFVADHFDFEITKDRDAPFVFHSCGGMEVLKYSGVRIFTTGENVSPNFAISDYAMAFDQLDFGDRYLWLPLARTSASYQALLKPRLDAATTLVSKTGFCSYVMSNTTHSDDARVRIFELLSKYKTVSSGGKWQNNVGGRVPDKHVFQAQHKFAIAFENCSYPGYFTEKFVDAAAANTIPIYWGDPEIGKWFNTKAFINCHDYRSFEEVVERIRQIDGDDELYRQMLSEPWFKDGIEPECFRRESIEKFLKKLFLQSPEQAYRRNRGRWGLKTEKKLYEMYFRPDVHFLKRLRMKWRVLYHKFMPYRKFY